MVFKKGMIPYNKCNLLNLRFGKLLVVEETSSRKGKSIWLCKCDCGNLTEVDSYSLKSGHTTSCGCNKVYFKKGTGHFNWKGGYSMLKDKLPLYDTYAAKLSYCEVVRKNDSDLLEVRCAYCGKFFIPKLDAVTHRLTSLNGGSGECRFYCSDGCKESCPIFSKILWPKGFKPATSREVQPELRQLVFERDNYTCQKCDKQQDELKVSLHCHHITGVVQNPIESADIDNCITFCKDCHKEVHKQKGCSYYELQCN